MPTHFVLGHKNALAGPLSVRAIALALLVQFLSLPSLAYGRATPQAGQSQSLGSLSSVGEVYVNDMLAPAESTIFVGDKLRTGENGVASFTASGKGTIKIAPHSEVVFAGAEKYVAELNSGTLVMSSSSGPGGFTLRLADFLLVPAVEQQQTTAKVEKSPDGSFLLSCLEGSASIISLQGASGLFLQAGQSAMISPTGQLTSNPATSGPTSAPSAPTQPQPGTPPVAQRKSRKGWIILGLSGGAAAGIAAAAAAGGGHHPVSPSSP